MLKGLLIASSLLACANTWALECSAPTTISDSRVHVYYGKVSANEKGEALMTWITEDAHNNVVEASYKTSGSSWSSPQMISKWEKNIYSYKCFGNFINPEGDLFAAWLTERKDDDLIQVAEKQRGVSWNPPLDWVDTSYHSFLEFDPMGNLVCAKELKVANGSEGDISAAALAVRAPFTSAPANMKNAWTIIAKEKGPYRGIYELCIVMNKKGLGYVFWVSNCKDIMCQKIQNGETVSTPEVIYTSEESIYSGLEGGINEKGDVALLCGRNTILTKFDDAWSSPFFFVPKNKESWNQSVAIDDEGNVMLAYQVGDEGRPMDDRYSFVTALYKPFGKNWNDPVNFSAPHADNEAAVIKVDGQGNFVMIWEQEARNRQAILGATFSATTQSWSEPQLLSPKGESCWNPSFVFFAPGKGYMAWTTTPNGFDKIVQVAELSN